MEEDDDTIVIIVGNENVIVKEEFLDQTDCTLASQDPPKDTIIVKEEILEIPVEFLKESESDEEYICEKFEEENEFDEADEVYEFEEVEETDEVNEADEVNETNEVNEADEVDGADEVIEADEVDEADEVETVDKVDEIDKVVPLSRGKKKPKQFKRKTIPLSQRKSLVKELQQKDPKLAKNKNLLISTLVKLMRSVQPPPLPQDYYTMNGVMLECLWCSRLSETIPAAGRHYQEKHGSRYLICYACGADFKSTTTLYVHEKRCTSPDAAVMLLARAVFLGNKGKQRPFLSLAKEYLPLVAKPAPAKKYRFECDICPAAFVSKGGLIAHLHLHNGLRPYRCHECPRAYTSPNALSRHIKKHSDIRYICDHCERPFKEKGALAAHLETHQVLQRYACSECGRRFGQKYTMLRHFDRKHLNAPPSCACQLCPQKFRRTTLLKQHMKEDHGMQLMTRKMFFKELPAMSDAQVLQVKAFKF